MWMISHYTLHFGMALSLATLALALLRPPQPEKANHATRYRTYKVLRAVGSVPMMLGMLHALSTSHSKNRSREAVRITLLTAIGMVVMNPLDIGTSYGDVDTSEESRMLILFWKLSAVASVLAIGSSWPSRRVSGDMNANVGFSSFSRRCVEAMGSQEES